MRSTGRFAPSPTGDLHFGSLVAAVASYLEARSSGGRWLVRIEDIDPPREIAGSADRILDELQRFGMRPDLPVLYQSKRSDAYEEAISNLIKDNKAYWCGCARSDLPSSGVYPGTCADGLPAGKSPRAVRLRVGTEPICFKDRIQGDIEANLKSSVGDFVIRRADGLAAYQLAVVIDDAFQGITEVVRGADLLDSTARQIQLQKCLDLPTPIYAHHPVAADAQGRKLSKRVGSDPISALPTAMALHIVLNFLGQSCPAGQNLDESWNWAMANWNLDAIPRTMTIVPTITL